MFLFGRKPLFGHEAIVGGSPRSPKWPTIRAIKIADAGCCAACGGKKKLIAHHIQPFHVKPELELDLNNLIVLCEDGPADCNCHFIWGHLGLTWKDWNPDVELDTLRYSIKRQMAIERRSRQAK